MLNRGMRRKAGEIFNYFFFPDIPVCLYCGQETVTDEKLCLCAHCLPYFDELELSTKTGELFSYRWVAPYRYEGAVRMCVQKFKYYRSVWYAKYMAYPVAEALRSQEIAFDLVTFVPMHPEKKRRKGYDHAQALAHEIALLSKKDCFQYVDRIKRTPSQTGLSAKQREKNMRGAFAPAGDVDLNGKNILLVDDVITTGSTAGTCADVLIKMGAASVVLAAYAKD